MFLKIFKLTDIISVFVGAALLVSCVESPQIQETNSVVVSIDAPASLRSSIALDDFEAEGPIVIYITEGSDYSPVVSRDCSQEQIECFRDCWNKDPPYPRQKFKSGHYEYCQATCREAYIACEEAQSSKRTFSTMQAARSWLYDHKAQALGAVVAVGFGLFVVATDGAVLLLVPKIMEHAPQLNYSFTF